MSFSYATGSIVLRFPFIEFLGMAKPPWGEWTPHRGRSRLSADLFGFTPLLSLAGKISVRLVAFPPAATEYSIPGFPPMADVKCLTLRSILDPETSAHPDLSEWLERQTNTASVIGSLLLCLSDTALSGKNRRLPYTSHHSRCC